MLYLSKMIACSAVLYALYFFVLHKEKMLVFNRFYLLGSLLVSFFIPLIRFTVKVPAPAPIAFNMPTETVVLATQPTQWIEIWGLQIILAIAVTVSIFFLARLVKNLLKIKAYANSHQNINTAFGKIVLLKNATMPFSVFNKIFLNKADYENGRVAESILQHEFAHIKQKHSLDILFIEVLQIFTWFNPMLYLYKRSIKINHEFLADDAVVRNNFDAISYQQLLLKYVYVNNNIPLASSFYFTTKKRIIMLQKQFKKKRAVWIILSAITLLISSVFLFSSKIYAHEQMSPNVQAVADTLKDPAKVTEVINKDISQKPPPPPPPPVRKNLPADVATIRVKSSNGVRIGEIVYKNGKKVSGDISTSAKEKAFEKKYGIQLPPPPPPPPPPKKVAEEMMAPPPPPPPPAKTGAAKKMETMTIETTKNKMAASAHKV